MAHRRLYHQLPTAQAKTAHAQQFGVKGVYPDMMLPNHARVANTAVDGMHTIKVKIHASHPTNLDVIIIINERLVFVLLSKSSKAKFPCIEGFY